MWAGRQITNAIVGEGTISYGGAPRREREREREKTLSLSKNHSNLFSHLVFFLLSPLQ